MPFLPHEGFRFLPPHSFLHLMDDDPDELSYAEIVAREKAARKEEIRRLNLEGKTPQQIAKAIGANVNTVRSYLGIIRKES